MLKKVLSVVLSAAMLLPTFGLNAAAETSVNEIILTPADVTASNGLTVGGDVIGGTTPGSWVKYTVDFGAGGYENVEINAAIGDQSEGYATQIAIGQTYGTEGAVPIASFDNKDMINEGHDSYHLYTSAIAADVSAQLTGIKEIYVSFTNFGASNLKNIRFYSESNDGQAEIVDLDPILNSTEGWSTRPGNYTVTSENGELTVSGSGAVAGYDDSNGTYHNKLLRFRLNASLEDDAWPAVYVRHKAGNGVFWESTEQACYGVAFKKDTIELQKSGKILEVPNEYVESNVSAEIVFGALDVENGVRLFLSVDGVTVFDYVDTENPYYDPGSIAVYAFFKPVTLQPVQPVVDDGTVKLDPIINSTEGWSPASKVIGGDGELTVAGAFGNVAAYGDDAQEYHNKLLKFKLKANLDNGEWPGFYVRHKAGSGIFWDGPNDCYGVVFKQDKIELQKGQPAGVSAVIQEVPNNGEYVQSNVAAEIVFGAVDVENGVRLFLSVDGETVFDYVDTENPYKDPGSIAVYAFGGPVTLQAIDGGSGTEPTPTPTPTPNPDEVTSESAYPRVEDERPEKVIEYDLDGTIYYVSADGTDSGNGTKENPWNSIAYALSVVPANQNATIFVKSGIYVEEKALVLKSGTYLIGEDRETTIVKTKDGTPGIYQEYGTGNIVAGLTFDGENNGDSAISFFRSRESVITDLIIKNYHQAFSLMEVKDGDFYNVYIKDTYGSQAGLSGVDCKFHDMVFDCYLPDENGNWGWGIDIGTGDYAYNWDLYDLSVQIPFRGNWNVGNGYIPPAFAFETCGGNIRDIDVYNCDFNNGISLVPYANEEEDTSLRFHNNIVRIQTGEMLAFEVASGLTNFEMYENLVIGGSHNFSNWGSSNIDMKVYRNVFDMLHDAGAWGNIVAGLGSIYDDVRFQNNTFVVHDYSLTSGTFAIFDIADNATNSLKYQNNILVYDDDGKVLPDGKNPLNAKQATVENNLFWNLEAFEQGVNNIVADPLFVGEGNSLEKYALTEGSPAIDAGINLEGHDVADGKTDLGALEYGEEPFKVGPYQEGYKPVNQFNFNGEDFDGNLPDWRDTIDSFAFVDTYIGWKDDITKISDDTLMDYFAEYDELNLVESYFVDPKAFGGLQMVVTLKDGSYDGLAGYLAVDGVSLQYQPEDESVLTVDETGKVTVANGGVTNLNLALMSDGEEVGTGSIKLISPAKNYDEKTCYIGGNVNDAWQFGSASGTSIVGFMGEPGAALEYHVNVPESGRYKLVLRYNGGYSVEKSKYDLSVNGEYVTTCELLGTGSWNPPHTHYEFYLDLEKGKNDIRFDWVSLAVNFEGLSVHPADQEELYLGDLDQVIEEVSAAKEENYDAGYWVQFEELLEKTIAYREAGEFASQQEIDDAFFDLKAMYLEMDRTYRQPVGIAIKSSPDKMVYAQGEKLDLSGLELIITNNDRTKIQIGLDEFEKYGITTNIVAGTEMSQEMHNGKPIQIITANGIVVETDVLSVSAPAAADKTELSDLVEKAEAIDTDGYTEESVKALDDAIAAAKAVLADKAATQEQVDAQIEALKAAVDGLEKKDDSSSSGEPEESKPDESKPGDETSEGDSSNEEGGKSPATGDNSQMAAIWIVMMAAGFAMASLLVYKRKSSCK